VSTAVYKEKNRSGGKKLKQIKQEKQYAFFPTIIKINISIKILKKKKYQSSIKGKLTINEVKTSEYQNNDL
jgi:hypothetical protein